MIAAAIVIAVLIAVVILQSVKVVPADSAFVVEKLGRYSRTLNPGVNVLTPFLDRIAFRYSLVPKDDELTDTCITLDNVAVSIRSTFRWQIVDAQKAAYETANAGELVAGVVRTAQRAWIGERRWSELRETTRELQQGVLRTVADPAAAAGVKVVAIDVQDIAEKRGGLG